MTGDVTGGHGGHGEEAGDDSWATRMPVGTVIKASRYEPLRTVTRPFRLARRLQPLRVCNGPSHPVAVTSGRGAARRDALGGRGMAGDV